MPYSGVWRCEQTGQAVKDGRVFIRRNWQHCVHVAPFSQQLDHDVQRCSCTSRRQNIRSKKCGQPSPNPTSLCTVASLHLRTEQPKLQSTRNVYYYWVVVMVAAEETVFHSRAQVLSHRGRRTLWRIVDFRYINDIFRSCFIHIYFVSLFWSLTNKNRGVKRPGLAILNLRGTAWPAIHTKWHF